MPSTGTKHSSKPPVSSWHRSPSVSALAGLTVAQKSAGTAVPLKVPEDCAIDPPGAQTQQAWSSAAEAIGTLLASAMKAASATDLSTWNPPARGH